MIVLYLAMKETSRKEENNGYVVFKMKYPLIRGGGGEALYFARFCTGGLWADNYVYVPFPYILHLTDSAHFPKSPDLRAV